MPNSFRHLLASVISQRQKIAAFAATLCVAFSLLISVPIFKLLVFIYYAMMSKLFLLEK